MTWAAVSTAVKIPMLLLYMYLCKCNAVNYVLTHSSKVNLRDSNSQRRRKVLEIGGGGGGDDGACISMQTVAKGHAPPEKC